MSKPRVRGIVAQPDTGDLESWLDFAMSGSSTQESPRNDLKTKDLAWIVQSTVSGLHEKIRAKLANELPILMLFSLYVRESQNSTPSTTMEQILESQKTASDKSMRIFYRDQLSLFVLVTGWETMGLKLNEVRSDLWKMFTEHLKTHNQFPGNMNTALQRMVIKAKCGGEDAEFLGEDSAIEAMLNQNLGTGKSNYLGTAPAMICPIIKDINALRKQSIQDKLTSCQKMIDNEMQRDPKLVISDKLKADLKEQQFITSKWREGYPACEGEKCQTDWANTINSMAKTAAELSQRCEKEIDRAKIERLRQRKNDPKEKPLSFTERIRAR